MKGYIIMGLLGLAIMLSSFAQQPTTADGLGSWYDDANSPGLFASHATYPFGTRLRVTNLDNNRQITIPVGGRMPRDSRWIIDVSMEGAYALGMNEVGFTRVRVEEIPRENRPRALRNNTSNMRKFFQTGHPELWAESSYALQVGHPSLPIGTKLRLTNRSNSQQLNVTVGARIRASQTRIVALPRPAADSLGIRFDRSGASTTEVTLESVD
jgi:rare lipoprotein A (peptidoglycan hydrolase)